MALGGERERGKGERQEERRRWDKGKSQGNCKLAVEEMSQKGK